MKFPPIIPSTLLCAALISASSLFADEPVASKEITSPQKAVLTAPVASTPLVFPEADWQRPSPEEITKYDKLFAEAKAYYDEQGGTSAMIIKDGIVIAEWGDVSRVSNLHSIRKSILSALIGIAVERKQMDLSVTLEELGVDDNEPSLTEREKKATVHDLIKARSGIYHPALYESAGMKKRRPERGSHAPGTFFYYNNWDFNALGTIYERATGESIYTALNKEIAKPIGMQDYNPSDNQYVYGEDSNHRAYPISMSTRDLARFALLFLNNGQWKEKQIIPASWVKESTHPYSSNDQGGYGYMWWTKDSPDAPAERFPGAYHAAGAGGQSAWIIPSRQLIVVHRVDTRITEKRVGGTQIQKLVELVLSALDQNDGATN